MALLHEPGKEMVGNGGEIEAGLFRAPGIANQIVRSVLLGHQLVAELDHDVLLPTRAFPAERALSANVRRR